MFYTHLAPWIALQKFKYLSEMCLRRRCMLNNCGAKDLQTFSQKLIVQFYCFCWYHSKLCHRLLYTICSRLHDTRWSQFTDSLERIKRVLVRPLVTWMRKCGMQIMQFFHNKYTFIDDYVHKNKSNKYLNVKYKLYRVSKGYPMFT